MRYKMALWCCVAGSLFPSLHAETIQRLTERSFSVAPGGQLEVRTRAGDILIRTWNKDEVHVRAQGIDESDLLAEQSGDLVRVIYERRSPSRDIVFEIGVPSSWNLDLNTGGGDISVEGNLGGRMTANTGGGDISFDNVEGEIRIKSSGGDIEGGGVQADVSVQTMGGDIEIGAIAGTAEIKTMGGDIHLQSVGGSLKTTTMGGNVEARDIAGFAEVSSQGGDVRLGRVSDGVIVRTAGGDVHLGGADGTTEIHTAGGDIVLANIVGSVEAKTAGGDIDAELSPQESPSSLISAGGDITVTVPANARATVEATIEVGRWGSRDYEITSDFDVEAGTLVRDDDSIRGVYEINGGGPKITLKTASGNIRIRRGGQ